MRALEIKRALFTAFLFLGLSSFWWAPFVLAEDLEFSLDINSATVAMPKVLRPNIDLSGRGYNRKSGWPMNLASENVLETWGNDIGFKGLCRIQYNLWEINQLSDDKELHQKLLNNYEAVIKKISDAGGTVILNIFSTPPGLGRALDRRSAPRDLRSFKALIKGYMRTLSCDKRYNIWYEVWSAPDLDDFFLDRGQDYLNMYRAVAESAKELEAETKMHIPVGGPGASWWFQDADGNTVLTPEKSLVYDLIRYCSRYRLPLDFVSWHSYTSDPKAAWEATTYNKNSVELVRDWLTYFRFKRDLPLLVSEWNYDSSANILPERGQAAHISASYIPSRLKNMYEAGIDYQTYFCLEDFDGNKEKVVRNVGVFWFDPESSDYKGGPKASYLVFRMLAALGSELFTSGPKINDDYVNAIAGKSKDQIAIIIYNYIDPYAVTSFISRSIAIFNDGERKFILELVRSGRLSKVLRKELDINSLRTTAKVKGFLVQLQELGERVEKLKSANRTIKLNLKGIKDNYSYQKYVVDASIARAVRFSPTEEKDILNQEIYQESLALSPYSVTEIILKKKPKEAQAVEQAQAAAAPSQPLQANVTAPAKKDINGTTGNVTSVLSPATETKNNAPQG